MITILWQQLADVLSLCFDCNRRFSIVLMTVNFSGVFLTVKNHGCIYTVCTEGELFSAPIYQDNSINFDEFDIVDFWESQFDGEELEAIQSTLIDMMKCAGLYFQQPMSV